MQENFPEYSSIRAYKPLGEGPAYPGTRVNACNRDVALVGRKRKSRPALVPHVQEVFVAGRSNIAAGFMNGTI
jgi:hypothetical protein